LLHHKGVKQKLVINGSGITENYAFSDGRKADAMKDPIVEEVRKNRMEHTRKFRGDLSAICADLRSVQKVS